MVPLHHRTRLTKSGENSPPSPPLQPQGGGGWMTPPSKIAPKTGRRYDKLNSLHAVLHGRDISDCPPRNRGRHRQRWRTKTCACHGEDRGGGKGEGGGDVAGGNRHGTSTTVLSCRRCLLLLRATVVLQDHVMRLLSGRPQLRVLLVSGAVHQLCTPDLAGQALDDAERIRRRRGEAEGEEATQAGKGSSSQGTIRRIRERGGHREVEREHKRPVTTDCPNHTTTTEYRSERERRG